MHRTWSESERRRRRRQLADGFDPRLTLALSLLLPPHVILLATAGARGGRSLALNMTARLLLPQGGQLRLLDPVVLLLADPVVPGEGQRGSR